MQLGWVVGTDPSSAVVDGRLEVVTHVNEIGIDGTAEIRQEIQVRPGRRVRVVHVHVACGCSSVCICVNDL